MASPKKETIWGIGRRKTAVARVRIARGTGVFTVNRRKLEQYFTREQDQLDVQSPLVTTKNKGKYDVAATVNGGGPSGQAGALKLGLSRAILKVEPTAKELLTQAGFLTRDSRMKERKKYGQRSARARFQFSKR